MWIELRGPETCQYRLEDPWKQPTGRLAQYLEPITLDPQAYGVHDDARLVGPDLVGVDRDKRIIEETLHLKELPVSQRRRLVLRSLLPRAERIDAPVCSLVDIRRWSGAYFHWFLDALPRLIAAEDHSSRSGERTLVIVPTSLLSWQEESLALLGVATDRRLPHRAPGRGGLQVRRLIAGVAHRWQRGGRAPFDAISPWAIRRLAGRFSEAVPLQQGASAPSRLFLSRRGAPNRNIANEEAVMQLLEPHGFVAVRAERLSLSEQITLFGGATHIVAPHGGALTNLMHARGGHLLELFQAQHGVRPEYFQLADINGLDYRFLLCPNVPGSNDIRVDIDRLMEWLAMTL
ncbi:glycosyltransferase family 61 protein [Cyanobium gracile]|uniref:Glycosyltransferase 61 catalytic domain-containing protein n=1 Tax=Cyanobium gracile (strain ATCC 27147 / PCC 6307) TaxID=292564 RepID=K9P797_CYAGP|nr:glycosyltransferase family 61 protein [Cyanobium gracile]AFY28429.1 hypothetical protein Cyagr_1251 [Cyanobium gracile PCC 6307]